MLKKLIFILVLLFVPLFTAYAGPAERHARHAHSFVNDRYYAIPPAVNRRAMYAHDRAYRQKYYRNTPFYNVLLYYDLWYLHNLHKQQSWENMEEHLKIITKSLSDDQSKD